MSRPENIIARWRIDAATWRKFIELNKTFNINEVSIRKHVPREGVEVIAGHYAIMVDGTVHTLSRSAVVNGHLFTWGGDWVVEQAALRPGAPVCVCLYMRMIRSGITPAYSNLVFPVAPGAERDAERVSTYFHQRAEEYKQMKEATGTQWSTTSWRAGSVIDRKNERR